MAADRTLWLLRHGERVDQVDPDWAAGADRPHDPPPTERGREQAAAAGDRLRGEGVGAVYSSPFTRAVATADAVARALDLPVRIEDGLCEHLNPEWFDAAPTVPTPGEHAQRFDAVVDDRESLVSPTFPESGAAAAARATAAARALLDADDRTLLLVGHGLTVGGVVDGLTGESVDAPLAGLTRLERAGDAETGEGADGEDRPWRVAFAAETGHYD
jgi:broad specificity phosphatase PhoE